MVAILPKCLSSFGGRGFFLLGFLLFLSHGCGDFFHVGFVKWIITRAFIYIIKWGFSCEQSGARTEVKRRWGGGEVVFLGY